ncbi:unnamed protein product [Strongylus vulgaris]|uniref:Uncharacterized protein n=1 Tax=Strongylus vulgaris TaxID=40348 RepID=A0A3P7LIF9_STRVU|nr:unnamed protein product [Strongylus vulgaris]
MGIGARELYYYQIPEHFTFTTQQGWRPRKRNFEHYCLRILLLNTKGKTFLYIGIAYKKQCNFRLHQHYAVSSHAYFVIAKWDHINRGVGENEAVAVAYSDIAERMLPMDKVLQHVLRAMYDRMFLFCLQIMIFTNLKAHGYTER